MMEFFWVKGSYTVEAAFVMPLILGILFAYLCLVFSLHDKVVIQAEMQGYLIDRAEGTALETKESDWQQELNKKLWFTDVGKVSEKKELLYYKISVQAETKGGVSIMQSFFSGNRRIEQTGKISIVQPESILRYRE